MSWKKDGKYLASVGNDKTVRIWDVETKYCIVIVRGHKALINSLCWSRDGKYLASGSSDQTVQIWDVEKKSCIKFRCHTVVRSVCWSDKYLAIGCNDTRVHICDVEKKDCIAILKGHTNYVNSVCWSGDGKYLASGSFDGTVRIWDIETKECIAILNSSNEYVESICWIGNDKYLVVGKHSSICIWDVETKKCIKVLEKNGWWNEVCSSNEYQYFASGSRDGTIEIFGFNERLLQLKKLRQLYEENRLEMLEIHNSNKSKVLNIVMKEMCDDLFCELCDYIPPI